MNTIDISPVPEYIPDQESRCILEWLSPLNFWSTQKNNFESRTEGTGAWFLNDPGFKKWLELGREKQGFVVSWRAYVHVFFHHADMVLAGVGKTILSYMPHFSSLINF